MSAKKVKVGLCLGGGAARGYALLPIIQNLTKLNITPKAVTGCSVGALIGAYYCLYGEVDTLYKQVKAMRKRDFLNLLDMNNPRKSLIKGIKVKKFLQSLYGEATFDDLKIPLSVTATKLPSFTVKQIQSGKLVDVVMASIAIPGIFPPYNLNNRYFIDGQITEHIPYQDLFSKYKVDKVLVVDLVAGANYTSQDILKLKAADIIIGSFYSMMKTTRIDTKISKKIYILTPQWEGGLVLDSLRFDKVSDNYKAGENIWNRHQGDIKKFLNY